MANEVKQVAALSRPVKPGMLYDCRNDAFLPGLILWTFDTLDGNITRNEQEYAGFEIITADHWGLTSHT
jgi:hypothetical protein